MSRTPRIPRPTSGELSTDEIFSRLLTFGKARQVAKTGSFGEHIFATVARDRGYAVERMHRNSIDFVVDGISVDVKTPPSRMGDRLLPPIPWRGKRETGVTYAQVEVTREALRVTWEDYFTEELGWASVAEAARSWANRDGLDIADAAARIANDAAWDAVRTELEGFFAERGMICEAIQRTVQTRFKDESPGNLVLKKYAPGALRVFVSYRRYVREDAIEYVIAFPCAAGSGLPMRPSHKNKLHIAKVDLNALPSHYRFTSLDDLRQYYSRLL